MQKTKHVPLHRWRFHVLSAVMMMVLASIVSAHQVVLLPHAPGTAERGIVPIQVNDPHLSMSPQVVDFGEVGVSSTNSQTVSVSNVSNHPVDIALGAPSGVTLSASTLTLAPGAVTNLTVTWVPNASTVLDGELSLSVTHAGVATAFVETIPVTGVAGSADLRFDVPAHGAIDVDRFDVGLISIGDVYYDASYFEMTITNQGSVTATDVHLEIPGPGGAVFPLGTCHWSDPAVEFCAGTKTGTNPDGSPQSNNLTFFGDLAPGDSVTAVWRLNPSAVLPFAKVFDVSYENSGTPQVETFEVAGEVMPYTIPGDEKLLRETSALQKAFASTVDSKLDDPLGVLRPASFDARTVFDLGEQDSVDLRTGNVTFVVPIGGPQHVRGNLDYQLQAVFNSTIWARRTMNELTREGPGGPRPIKPLNAEAPDPAFNLGYGWGLHLGRLIEPFVFDGIGIDNGCPSPSSILDYEKKVNSGERFVYIDASGTRHEFWRKLHGEEIRNTGQNATSYLQTTKLYTRDGSYLRMGFHPSQPNRRWIEEPNGTRHNFVEQSSLHPTMPDRWLLESIEDSYGNKVTIEYGANTWTIRDHEGAGNTAWRTVVVTFSDWAGRDNDQPMVVSRVDLPGFGNDPARSYNFAYTVRNLGRPSRSLFHNALQAACGTNPNVARPQLDSITLPDSSVYRFTYEFPADDRIRLKAVNIPTGGKIDYSYATVWDSPPDCVNRSLTSKLNGVSRRRVVGANNITVLDDRRYLRESYRTSDVPDTICQILNPTDNSNSKPPWSEQMVVVWQGVATGLSSAKAHYFNLYPYSDDCGFSPRPECEADGPGRYRLKSGRDHAERNLMISHSQPGDPIYPDLHLSTETYSCAFNIGAVGVPRDDTGITGDEIGDDVSVLLGHNSCTKRETSYARYDVALAGQCDESSPHCLIDSRLSATRTVYHDDANRWRAEWKSNYDGLGHYRRIDTWSSFENSNGRLEQARFRRWNPSTGTLVLDDDHRVSQNITPPATWLLETWDHHWITEGGKGRGGEACFDPLRGHMTHERTWASTTVNTGNIAANRTNKDVIVRHAVDGATGELDLQRFFGANTYAVPTSNAWCTHAGWTQANQDYAVSYDYQYGFLAEKKVVGATTYEVRQTIDKDTGWVVARTLNSGESVTHDYDPMGRLTWLTANRTASHHFDYQQQTDDRWELVALTYPAGTSAATTNPNVIRSYTARYDGLGRLRSEDLPTYDGAGVTRSISYYTPGGQPRLISSLDDPSRNTQFEYDYRRRLVKRTDPNGRKTAFTHVGDRKVKKVECVKTGTASTSGICNGTGLEASETIVKRDWAGRTIETESGSGIRTFFDHDPAGNVKSASRSGSGITQTRTWGYNGLDVLTSESIPERNNVTVHTFNTRGQPLSINDAGRTVLHTYDSLGRLRTVKVSGNLLKSFTFCDQAAHNAGQCNKTTGANGQLIKAVRNNVRSAATSGRSTGGTWSVTSTFAHDSAGRTTSRVTDVLWDPHSGANGALDRFTQSWTYDDLGNVTSFTYPAPNSGSATARTVHYTHTKGFFLTDVIEGSLGADLTYHPSGLVHRVEHDGSGGNDIYGVSQGMPRIASIDLGNGSGQRFNLGSVSYDGAGNITAIGSDVFGYDRDGRLTSATVQGTAFTYGYDNFDNHTIVSNKGTVDPTNNQLVGGTAYDPYGNLESALNGAITVTYDAVDKMVRLREPDGTDVFSIYDHDDLRVLGKRSTGEWRFTLRDGLRVVREVAGLGTGKQHRKDFIYAGSRLLSSHDVLNNQNTHYHQDQVGNARLLTGGTPCGGTAGSCRVHYEPFGDPLASDSAEPTVGFQGHENDGYSTYMRGRSYLTSTARFIQVDPSRDASTWSQYGFAANNPILKTDPTGLCVDGCVVSGPVIVTAAAAGLLYAHLSSPSAQDPNKSNFEAMVEVTTDLADRIGDAAITTASDIGEVAASTVEGIAEGFQDVIDSVGPVGDGYASDNTGDAVQDGQSEARKRGSRFKRGQDALEQADGVRKFQDDVRAGKKEGFDDMRIDKSKRRLKNALRDVKTEEDGEYEFGDGPETEEAPEE